MADDETQRWIKDHLMEQKGHTATILQKLETGESRMCIMQVTLDAVSECTREFPALKLSVRDLEAAEARREQDKVAELRARIAKSEADEAEKMKTLKRLAMQVGLAFCGVIGVAIGGVFIAKFFGVAV